MDFFQVYRIFRKIIQKYQIFCKLSVKIQGFMKNGGEYQKFKISGTKLLDIWKEQVTYKIYRIF